MNRTDPPTRGPTRSVRLPRWMALILAPIVFLLAHVAVPRQLASLSARHGWVHRRPGRCNLLGVIPIGLGAVCLGWCLWLHVAASHGPFEVGRTQRYLVVRGPYQYTRNPMYLAGMAIWLGWVIVYGSVAVLVGGVAVWGSVALLVVPWEERALEARFGAAYRRYRHTVPRWLGRPHHTTPPP